MARVTNYQMAYRLSIKTHREKYPVVRWIEENIASGAPNTDYGTSFREVVQEVRVSYGGLEGIDYVVKEGQVCSIVKGYRADPFFADEANPKKEEIDLVEIVDPEHYRWLRLLCMDMPEFFDHPHSCDIEYYIMEEKCPGCQRIGPVNHQDSGGWKHYCGGSPRCCP